VLDAVRSVDRARHQVNGSNALLRDVDGGWDVGIGNIVLGEGSRPTCVAHGELELTEPATYECATCGARARYG
jgi:hypothetical protein